MMEYIDRDTAVSGLNRVIENLRKEATTHIANRAVDLVQYSRDYIQSLPAADVVPMVRCRECKHYREHRTKTYGNLICRCTRMGRYDMDYPVRPDDFCSYGERSTKK